MIVLIMIVVFGLNSASFLDSSVKYAIEKSGLDIHYAEIKGGLYSGLEIKDFNYQDDIKASLKLDIDFPALKEGKLYIKDLNLSHLQIDKDFLASLLKPNNKEKEKGDNQERFLKEIIVDSLHFDTQDIAYEDYRLDSAVVDVRDFHYDMKKQFSGDIEANIASNVAKANITVTMKDSQYDLHIGADIKRDFITPYLKESNITIVTLPFIMIDAKGDLEEVVIDTHIDKGVIKSDAIMIATKSIDLHTDVGIKSGDIKARLEGEIDSDMAGVSFVSDANLNSHDINETLAFSFASDIKGNRPFLEKLLKEQNASLLKLPSLHLDAKGDLKNVTFISRLKEGEIDYQAFKIYPKALDLEGHYNVVQQQLDINLLNKIDSNVANVDCKTDVQVNLKDINQTLHYQSEGKITAQSGYLASLMRDANVSVSHLSPLSIQLKGDAKAMDVEVDLDGVAQYNDLKIAPTIKNTNLHLNLLTKELQSKLHIMIDSNKADITLDSNIALNVEDINNTLEYKADMKITDAKAYAGVDLSYLGDIVVDINGSLKSLKALLHSPKIDLRVDSKDFNHFVLKMDSERIYLGKIYAAIPEDLKESFVALKADGFYLLKEREGSVRAKLKGFKYNRHILRTNTFTLKLKDDDITLSPLILQSKNFKLMMQVKKEGKFTVAHLKNRTFNADAKFNLDPLNLHADAKISSIKALLEEIDKIYPVNTKMGIDGALRFKARMVGDRVKAQINSDKITLPEGRLEDVNIMALYAPHKVLIKNFDFKMRGFESKDVNRNVRLTREGVITFDDENATVDIELENLLRFKGEKKADVITGNFSTKDLALSYPEYGKMKLTTNLEMYQANGKMAVTGEVLFKETEVNYESRFMDISKDSDIIILSQESKKRKEKLENDAFLANTFLDIKIKSSDEILYKVRDGEIEMQPNLIIRKDFGQPQKITGKIKILDGMYDFADKRFKIKEGAVAFRGQTDINPLLDLHVEYDEIQDVTIMIDIGGDKNRPKLTFSSIPQMSKKDIFSYLLFGMSASETEGAASSANKAAERIFGRAVAKDLARELHLDRLDMNRNADGGIDIKAGKKIKRKTFVYYQNKSTESSIIVERKLSKSWEVDTEVGKRGQSIDFVYRKGFK